MFLSQYQGGIFNGDTAQTHLVFRGNAVIAASATQASRYCAIRTGGTDEVTGNTRDVSRSSGPATSIQILATASTGGLVIRGNSIIAGTSHAIQINNNVTGAVVMNNSLDRYCGRNITDNGVSTRRTGKVASDAPLTGTAVLVAGTVTVTVPNYSLPATGATVILQNVGPAGTPGILSVGTITYGPDEHVRHQGHSGTDTSTVRWWLDL